MEHSAARRVFGELRAVEVSRADDVTLPRIEGYILDRLLGRGAGGDVYRGFREGSDRPLAIKILRTRLGEDPFTPGHPGGQASSRAWRELDVLTQLRLPALPRVIDHGVHEGRLYIATEYVDGLALDKYCQTNNLDRRHRVELLARVADAVHSLHEMGVIHRDIKPSNILVDINGQPIIIDLGIASLLTDDVMETLTAEGAPIGSPAFMSPEQARGARREISTRSDVFGLGATAYLVLTGQTPHEMDATIHESVRRVAQDEPRDPRAIDGSLPRDLAAVLSKAVAREPSRRYASAVEFADDLRCWFAGEPVTATTPGPWSRCTRWITKHPISTTTTACAVIALTIVGSSGFVTWRLSTMPNHLDFSQDRRTVSLVTAANTTLRTWQGVNARPIAFAKIVDRPSHLGGGRVLMIATNEVDSDPHTGELCFYNLNEYDAEPYWTSAGTIILPDQLRYAALCDIDEDAFELYHADVADVFPEEPGLEIIAFHRHKRFSPTLIRVYDLNGHVLFETWHDGHLNKSYWMPGPGLIVATGCNSDGKWIERGKDATRRGLYPTVVFAVRPELGVTGQILSWSGFKGTMDPAWYLCVLPSEINNFVNWKDTSLNAPSLNYPTDQYVQFEIQTLTNSMSSYSWILDAHGQVIDHENSANWPQEYGLPSLSEMKLGVLPERITPRPTP
jgi:serine/threonine protein kinase